MTDWTLTKTKMQAGVWQGVVTDALEQPELSVTYLDRAIDGVVLIPGKTDDTWHVQIPIPSEAVSDGVQTLLIKDARTDTVMDHVTLIAGEALAEDMRAEVDLLRAELDMLKRAFRRHCVETT